MLFVGAECFFLALRNCIWTTCRVVIDTENANDSLLESEKNMV